MKLRSLTLLSLLFTLGVVACGGDDDNANSAVAKCRALPEAICSKYVSCNLIKETMAECVSVIEKQIDSGGCSRAKQVSANYDQCMSLIRGASCEDAKGDLPPVCNQVILFDR